MTDLRIRRTKKHLRDALMDLMGEKPYEAITVAEITERAMVNRATFYRHYEDKGDLFDRGISDMLVEIKSIMEPVPVSLTDYEIGELPRNSIILLDHIHSNKEFYRLMLGPNGVGEFVSRLRAFMVEMYHQRAELIVTRHKAVPKVPLSPLAHVWAGEVIGLITWWVDGDCRVPKDDVAAFITAYVVIGTYGVLNVPAPTLRAEFYQKLDRATKNEWTVGETR